MRKHLLAGLAAVLLAAGCSGGPVVDTGSCEALFGSPGENTGLDESACRPERICDGVDDFVQPLYDEATLASLRDATLRDPPQQLPGDPYADDSLVPTDTGGVCAVMGGRDRYALETFPDGASAEAAGGTVTHEGACGACSSLQDLAVYLAIPDLGTPVRECALIELGQNPEATLDCILDLGFTEPCAQIWLYNSLHTRAACLTPCLEALGEPFHLEDGSINACLACDEEQSGPVFKAVAGRTRRTSGIASAICRPGDGIAPIRHDAYP
jgi:hypothetical protein